MPGIGVPVTAGQEAANALTPAMPEAPPAPKVMPTMDEESLKAARRRAAARMMTGRQGRDSTVMTGQAASSTLGGN